MKKFLEGFKKNLADIPKKKNKLARINLLRC